VLRKAFWAPTFRPRYQHGKSDHFWLDAASDRRSSGARGNRAPWSRQEFKFLHEDLFKNPAAILVIAFVAGFSERFITGAIERISEQSSKTKSS
jgi:hypothetical protein